MHEIIDTATSEKPVDSGSGPRNGVCLRTTALPWMPSETRELTLLGGSPLGRSCSDEGVSVCGEAGELRNRQAGWSGMVQSRLYGHSLRTSDPHARLH